MGIDNVADITPRLQYVASAAQTAFDYNFSIFTSADLVVVVDGVTKALDTDYTVDRAEEEDTDTETHGGTVTFLTPMTGGEIVTIYRDIVIERDTDIQQNGPWSSTAYNDEQDKTYLIMQQIQANVDRSLRLPIIAEVASDDIVLEPANFAGMYLAFDADGKPTPAVLSSTTLTQELLGPLFYPAVAAEGSSVVAAYYPYGDIRRYGAATAVSDNSVALQAALDSGFEVYIPPGTWSFASTLTFSSGANIRGEGFQNSVLRYTGSGTALASATPSARTYGQVFKLFKISDGGTGTLGLNLGSVSSSELQGVYVSGFTTGYSLTGSNGYCVYNRFIDCLADNATTGWIIGGSGSNSNTLAYCRTNICTTGIDITDSNHTAMEHCQFESGTTAIKITSTTTSLSDRTTIFGCRFEGNTTNVNITSSFVRETALLGNHHVNGSVTDSGLRTLALDPFGTAGPNWLVQSSNTASANGSFRFVRLANGSTGTPAMVIRDDASGSGTPYTLQLETERDTGSFWRGQRGGATYMEAYSTGAFAIKDGITAPSTVSGMAVIYVDTADGDLKVKFGDGTVKTIVVDT